MTTRRKPDSGPEPNLPITPMLDMAFQLLAFFVMTYHPSDLEGQMDLSLPSEAKETRAKEASQVSPDSKPDKDELDIQANVTVMVRTQQGENRDGLVSALMVETDAGQGRSRASTSSCRS